MSQRWQAGHSVGPSRYPKAGRINECVRGQRQSLTSILETRLFPTPFQPQTRELALHRSEETELSTHLHSQLLITGWEGGSPESRPVCACSVALLCPTMRAHGLQPARLPLSMGFPRQEYWSGLPLPPPGDLPRLRDRTLISCVLVDRFLTRATREASVNLRMLLNPTGKGGPVGLRCSSTWISLCGA